MALLANLTMLNNQPVTATYNTLVQSLDGGGAVAVGGSVDVTLTNAQAANAVITLTGVLTADIDVLVPQRERHYIFLNSTTGAFGLIVRPVTSGTGMMLEQGLTYHYAYCNGVNLERNGLGRLGGRVVVENNVAVSASPNIIELSEADKTFTNSGAPATNYHTLPAALAGVTLRFICQSAVGMRVVAATGDTIRIGGSVSASGGRIDSTSQGDVVTLMAINSTEWMAITQPVGTWTVT